MDTSVAAVPTRGPGNSGGGSGGVLATNLFSSGSSRSCTGGGGGIMMSNPPCAVTDYLQLSTSRPNNTSPDDEKTLVSNHCNVLDDENMVCDSTKIMDENAAAVWSWLWSCLWSVVEAIFVIYLPFMWQSLLGGFAVLRCVLLGQLLVTQKDAHVAGSVFQSTFVSTMEPAAVSSCLTLLALLACVAMAVHPDGFTWMVLRKLRELFMSIMHSSTTCWAWLLNDDTGVISTVLALATFCSLFFFCYVLHRTLAPKQPRPQKKPNTLDQSTVVQTPKAPAATSASSSSKKRKKKKSSAKKRASQSNGDAPILQGRDPPEAPSDHPQSAKTGDALPTSAQHTARPKVSAPSVTSPQSQAVPNPETTAKPIPPKPMRQRVESTSTVETASSSVFDDDSSVLVVSAPPQHTAKQRYQHRSKRGSNVGNRGGRPAHNNNHNDGSVGNNNINNKGNGSLVVSSRWDALKPEAPSATPRTQRKQQQQPQQNKPNNLVSPVAIPHRAPSPRGTGVGSSCSHNQQQPYPHPQSSHRASAATPSAPRNNKEPHAANNKRAPSFQSRADSDQISNRHAAAKTTDRCVKHKPQLTAPSPPPPQSPRNNSFFSELNPQTPPFAPATPPRVLRAPPGFCLPEQQNINNATAATTTNKPLEDSNSNKDNGQDTDNGCVSSFFLPPAYRAFEPFATSLQSSLSSSSGPPSAPPASPGLMVSTTSAAAAACGATLPAGSGSPLCFRYGGGVSLLSENPFEEEENEAQIEAELQELGGRMIGSILDS